MSTIDNSQLNGAIVGMAAMQNEPRSARVGGGGSSANSWYLAMSRAWGETLDGQANRIVSMSEQIGDGTDNPSHMIQLTAESQRMSFMSTSAATSQNSVGEALGTLGKRQ